MTALAPHMEAFLREHLIRHRGASRHTCDSFPYSFQCLSSSLRRNSWAPSALRVEQLDAALVCTFLEHLETTRGNSAETRNVRWLHPFVFRFLEHREPAAVGQVRQVMAIPFRPISVSCFLCSSRKCRPCSTLLIHPRGRGSEIGRCCILRCAPVSASRS